MYVIAILEGRNSVDDIIEFVNEKPRHIKDM